MKLTIVDICGNALNKRTDRRKVYNFPLIQFSLTRKERRMIVYPIKNNDVDLANIADNKMKLI